MNVAPFEIGDNVYGEFEVADMMGRVYWRTDDATEAYALAHKLANHHGVTMMVTNIITFNRNYVRVSA